MKGNLFAAVCLFAGIGCGMWFGESLLVYCEGLSTMLLYVLIVQVGLNIGSKGEWSGMLHNLRFSYLLLPLFTIVGTLAFSALAGVVFTPWSLNDCLAVGSGLGYYSLSSLLIVQLKGASAGAEVASQLASVALLTNIVREMIALFGASVFVRYFGRFAPIAASGVTSMDVCLPVICRWSGQNAAPVAIVHGVVLEVSVPLLVSFFCG